MTEKNDTSMSTLVKSGSIEANGLHYYYEMHGKGEPLLLLHGGLGHIGMFGPVLTEFAKDRLVIAVDLHGHGRTSLGSRHVNLVDMGNDMALIVKGLGYDSLDVIGYSFGGGVSFRFAAQHPEMVRKLVIASAPFAQNGYYPEMLPQQAMVSAAMFEMMKETPMYKSYAAVAPDSTEFPRLLDEMGNFMKLPYDWTDDVKKLTMPTMLVYGDADMITLDHITKFYHLLGGAQQDAGWQREHMSKNRLAILPNLTHYEVFMSPAFADVAVRFLKGEEKAGVWGEVE